MNNSRLITALTIAVVGVVAAPAAQAGAPPVKGGVHCHQEPKRSYRLSQVARHGMAIKIVCDGPARFFAVPEFVAMTQQDRDLTDVSGHSIPAISRVRPAGMSAAGSVSVRPRLTRLAVRIMRRYRMTKIKVGLGVQREDGAFWSEPGDWGRTSIVR